MPKCSHCAAALDLLKQAQREFVFGSDQKQFAQIMAAIYKELELGAGAVVGDTVAIYEKPLTQEGFEGTATLIKLLKDDTNMQYWRVLFFKDKEGLFMGETEEADRWIKK